MVLKGLVPNECIHVGLGTNTSWIRNMARFGGDSLRLTLLLLALLLADSCRIKGAWIRSAFFCSSFSLPFSSLAFRRRSTLASAAATVISSLTISRSRLPSRPLLDMANLQLFLEAKSAEAQWIVPWVVKYLFIQ
jgi:hypothetical protein